MTKVTTRNNLTLRRGFLGLITAAAVMVVQLWTATPAHADHTVTVRHVPPPTAAAGSDTRLVAVVDGCWIFCSRISLEVTYRTGDGRKRTIDKNLDSFHPQIAVIVIPGRHVAKPAISYFIEASQNYCHWAEPCHAAEARLPERGSYAIPVR